MRFDRLRAVKKVISAAPEAGYNSPSAFIARFKKLLGCTPGRDFADAAAN
jgi:AraC-like DNA-binding protein